MPELNRRKMQALITKTARLYSQYYEAQALLNAECLRVYGVEPGEIDCDQVIDAVMGGCGNSPGMTVDDFDTAMREAVIRSGKR